MSPEAGGVQAAIDLGTNTILMVTGRAATDGSVEILDDAHAIARLGKGVDAERRISAAAVDRVCGLLLEYRRRADAQGALRILAFGTSALRDAANKSAFIEVVAQRTGIPLSELSGDEEARHTFAGAGFGLDLPERYAVVDIGGGSTELATGSRAAGVERSQSVDVGAVRVTERCFPALPPTIEQRQQATTLIDATLATLFELPEGLSMVGVAGTATTLGALDAGAPRFDADLVNGHFLSSRAVHRLSEYLLDLPHAEIVALPQVSDQRADIIGAGSLILDRLLAHVGHRGLTVSTRGIRYGLLMEMLAGRL